MAKTQLREDVTLARPNASGVLLGERVREAGLDPSVFCAVIPGECGTAGLVNGNGRIYQIAEAVSEHERLCRDATISPSFGERDHPDSGPSWNVITRFTGGRTEILEDGSAKFLGTFGVLNSSLGQDMLVNWRAGVPIGVSLRARGVLTEHTLDEGSPFAKMNPSSIGRRVQLVSEVEFAGYDWVRMPSAGTFLPPPNTDVAEAYSRLAEATQEAPEEDAMPKTFAEFESAYPETVKQFRAEASASASSLTEAVAAKDTELRLLRDELRETKTANAGQAEMLKELVETARSQKAEIAAARLKTDVAEALDAFVVGRRAGAIIKNNVMEELAEGRISDVAAAVKRAEKFAGVADAASALPLGGAAGGETAKRNVSEASDGGIDATETRAGASAKLKALIGGRA